MTSYINALNAAIYSKLSGGTALISALGGTAIYHGIAPEGRALPYVIWSYAAGGHENMTPNESVNAVVYIRAYAVDAKTAAQLDGYVAELLETTLSMTGWNNIGWHAKSQSYCPKSTMRANQRWSQGLITA